MNDGIKVEKITK